MSGFSRWWDMMASEAAQLPKTSAVLAGWTWDSVKYRAASQVADGVLKNSEIAAIAGITDRQLRTWKKHPPFAALVAAITGSVAVAFQDEAVASKAGRIRILIDMHNKLLAVIEERAERYAEERSWAPGESTGLIVTKESIGMSISKEASIDTGLLKSMLDIQERISKELSQWDYGRVDVKHSGRVDHVVRIPQHLHNLSDDELAALERIALKAQDAEHEVLS